MTEFITRNHGHSCFEIFFKTTDPEHYKAIQDFARLLIDHKNPVTDNNVGSKWIPVSERLPESEKDPVLIAMKWGTVDIGWCENGRWGSEFVIEFYDGEVTHWMPLPSTEGLK